MGTGLVGNEGWGGGGGRGHSVSTVIADVSDYLSDVGVLYHTFQSCHFRFSNQGFKLYHPEDGCCTCVEGKTSPYSH